MSSTATKNPEFMTAKMVASELGVCAVTAHNILKDVKPARKLGRLRLFSRDQIEPIKRAREELRKYREINASIT